MGFEAVRDSTQESATRFATGLGIDGEGFGGKLCGAVEFLQSDSAIYGLDRFACFGSEGLEAGAVAGAAVGADEGESGEIHNSFSVEQTSSLYRVAAGLQVGEDRTAGVVSSIVAGGVQWQLNLPCAVQIG